jgi:hypothetical protein
MNGGFSIAAAVKGRMVLFTATDGDISRRLAAGNTSALKFGWLTGRCTGLVLLSGVGVAAAP